MSFACLTFVLIVGVALTGAVGADEPYPVPDLLNVGPYVDSIEYRLIPSQDQRILALQTGEIEMDTSFLDMVNMLDLGCCDPDIDVFSSLRNGYGHISINCREYPLNISGLRRAFAFAFDKTRVTAEIMDGFSREHDSLVPFVSGWCAEEDLPYHYYTAQPGIGNRILDNLGFEVDPETGWRNAPDGTPFEIAIDYASSSPEIAGGVAQIAVDALHSLHIDARRQASDFQEYIRGPRDYDMVFYAKNFDTTDVQWLAYEFDLFDDYQYPMNFHNESYDALREELLTGTTYDEVYDAAAQMQRILHENVPRLVVYENIYMQGYRNDIYEGHVPDLTRAITGPWTMRKIHRIDGTEGGLIPVAIAQEPDSFNLFVADKAQSWSILDNLYSSLFAMDPNQHPVMDLARGFEVETHEDDPGVLEGHVMYTLDIVRNATWSDGIPLTAEDVAFTFTYLLETMSLGNPAGYRLTNLESAVALDTYKVRLDFNTESYWHFNSFAFTKIVPKHIFNDVDGIGYQGWNLWNPVFDSDEPLVTCGPYVFDDYEAGAFYRIARNPLYHYYPRVSPGSESGLMTPHLEFDAGTSGHEVVWIASQEHSMAGTYTLREGDRVISEGTWTGGSLSVDVSGLPPGNHTLTLEVTYLDGHQESSQVVVMVRPTGSLLSTLFKSTVFYLAVSLISAQVIVGVVILSVRDYRRWKQGSFAKIQEEEHDWFKEIFWS